MKQIATAAKDTLLQALVITIGTAFAPAVFSQQVTFAPYIQLGDNGPFGPADQMVIAWQTDEASPKTSAYKVEVRLSNGARHSADERRMVVNPQARVVDNYLAADPSLPAVAGAYGAHSNYTVVLGGLEYDTEYRYRVSGPGMPAPGFVAAVAATRSPATGEPRVEIHPRPAN